MPDVTVEPAAAVLPGGLDELRDEAEREGISNVATVVERWIDGSQHYDRPGESLLIARRATDGRVVAVGGVAWCPDVDAALRVRRFYVSPPSRRRGIARRLAHRLIEEGARSTSVFTCNARASAAAAPFWESLGFRRVDTEGITHRLDLTMERPTPGARR